MIQIPRPFLDSMKAHAEREYPRECCGLALGPLSKPGTLSRLEPCLNVQDRMHAEDPALFSRTSRNAYFMDPGSLLCVQRKSRERGEEIRLIYHSHVDAEPVFSREDEAMALFEGEPVYPGVHYLVISVVNRKAVKYYVYGWNAAKKKPSISRETASGPAARQTGFMDKRQRILVVDDEPNIRRSLVVRLENAGYRVDTAENGHEAIAFYHRALKESASYDLVLLDLIMPGINGLEVLDTIRQHENSMKIPKSAETPIIILTAMSDSWEEDARYEGCDEYVQKPFKTDVLMEAIRKRIRPPR